MGTTMLLALVVGLGVLMVFIGLARTPSTNTAEIVQQRLSSYGGATEKPLTIEEMELQRPFAERFLRPAQGAAEKSHALLDLGGVPEVTLLFVKRNQGTIGAGSGRPPGIGQQHEGE